MPSVNNVWANNVPSAIGEQRTLPSGQTCQAKRLSIEDLVATGIIEKADSLTSIVDQKHVRKVRGGKGPDTTQIVPASVMKDADAMRSIVTLVDKAMPVIVLDPVVRLHYVVEDGKQRMLGLDEREAGVVYTDQISFVDKMELFAWAIGDMNGLQTFRGFESGDAVGAVADGVHTARPAKRTAGGKRH